MHDAQAALAAVAEEIAKLRTGYVAGLPAEFETLAALAQQVRIDTADRTVLDDLHHRLHKLAGSGGTFGLQRLSTHARRLEQMAKAWLASGSISATEKPNFLAGIAELTAALEDTTPPEKDIAYIPPTPAATAPTSLADAPVVSIWLVATDARLGQELASHMEQFGYSVRILADLEQAGIAATSSRPDALIVDIDSDSPLSSASTPLLGPSLRALAIPLVLISDRDDFQVRMHAVRSGAAGFVTKPIDVPQLEDRLAKVFDDLAMAPCRVMIVDDDAALAAHYRLVLQAAGMEVDVLDQPEIVLDRVAAFRPDVVLMDMHMPDYSGPELASVIRQHDNWISLPIVYLSAETDIEVQINALGRGADDFLTKPISDVSLVAAVRVRVKRSRQIDDLMAKDSLTGLLKHSRIKEELAVEMARARRTGKPMSVVMLDIDHFKRVNDSYGHATGDRVIKAISLLLKQRLRRTDIVGRYGGEEFAVVLPGCDVPTALQVIDDIRTRFGAVRFHTDKTEFGCTISAGVAGFVATGGDPLIAADEALYAAKHGGRNRVCAAGQML